MIRSMALNDLNEIISLESTLFKTSAWTKEAFESELESNDFAHYYVLEISNQIVGYIGLWLMYEQSQITTLGVNPNYQGHHYSYQLLEKCIQRAIENNCSSMTLEVRVSNQGAIYIYEKFGFEKVAVRKNYYADNEDAYLMFKPLREVVI